LGTVSIAARLSALFLTIVGKLADAFAGLGKTLMRDVSVSGEAPPFRAQGDPVSECGITREATISLDGRIKELIRPPSQGSETVSIGWRVGRVI